MKIFNFLLFALFAINGYSQDETCDDFTDIGLWPESMFSDPGIIGYTQDDTQTITAATDTWGVINSGFDIGILCQGTLDFSFDGSNQIALFKMYGIYSQFSDMGFSVNGSSVIYLDDTFPMTIGGVEVDLDMSPPNDGEWEYFNLTFTGVLDEVSHVLLESGFVELCVEPIEGVEAICDDFTDSPWPSTSTAYSAGEILGYSQEGTQPITVGTASNATFGPYDPGIYVWNILNFAFDGSDQTAKFNIYGWIEQYNAMGFAINGSAVHFMNETFPMTIGGVTIDLDDSAIDIGDWDNAYLIFSGDIDEIDIIGFESGITELCVEPNEVVEEGCDDFTDIGLWPEASLASGEIIGYTQGGTETITGGTDVWGYVNSSDEGIYGVGPVNFSFDGTNQVVRFKMYGYMPQFNEMGYSVNGSTIHFTDESFPITVDGIEIDIDLSPTDTDFWEYYYLIFTGEIDEISHVLFESGIVELCVEPNEAVEEGCDDFTDIGLWPEATILTEEIIGYTQGGTETVTTADSMWYEINNVMDGIYGGGPVDFSFDGSNQIALFKMYGIYSQFNEMGFSINGSTVTYLDGTFPMTIGGVEVDLDLSPPNDGPWEYFNLTFTGVLDEVSQVLFESGIVELCVEPIEAVEEGCDDFTDIGLWPEASIEDDEILGYTQDGTQAVTAGEGWGYINSGSTDGIFGGGIIDFSFDGSNQIARFKMHGMLDGFYEMGFSVNGSDFAYLNETFPMTVGGVEVDIDLSVPDIDFDEYFYLTFTGEIDEISHLMYYTGFLELCVEPVDVTEINTANLTEFTVYPNPTNSMVTIQNSIAVESIEIYSIAGELIYTEKNINSTTKAIDLTSLNTGLYLVKIQTINGDEMIQKLIKE